MKSNNPTIFKPMPDSRKKQLINLGAEALAEALLTLAARTTNGDDFINHLFPTPSEIVQYFRQKISGLKYSGEAYDWQETSELADELEMLVQDIKDSVDDPLTGIELLAEFFEADEHIFDSCDDSDGDVGEVFLVDATELFAEYALRCEDKEKVAEILLRLTPEDQYGVRDELIDCAEKCLPEQTIRTMVARLQERLQYEKKESFKRNILSLIQTLARQLKDARLFEENSIAMWGELSCVALIDSARIYLENGDTETARSRLEQIPTGETFKSDERDELLEKIYHELGDTKKLTELLYKKFRCYRTVQGLQALLDVIGNDRREEVIADEVKLIVNNRKLNDLDARFLVAVGRVDEAEAYLMARTDKFNSGMESLAAAMTAQKRCLVSSLMYRRMLLSILAAGNSRFYPSGIEYLKTLDKIAESVTDWKEFGSHEAFKEQLIAAYGRKRSFWSNYGVKK